MRTSQKPVTYNSNRFFSWFRNSSFKNHTQIIVSVQLENGKLELNKYKHIAIKDQDYSCFSSFIYVIFYIMLSKWIILTVP